MDLKIASLNVRGIGNNTKRREVLNWLRSKKLSIYMLQEVHCSETPQIYGLVNGAIKRFLVFVQAIKRESAFFSTTLLIYRSLTFFQTQTAAS